MPFSKQPVDITVNRGGDARFSCTYRLLNLNITWNGPGVEAGSITRSINMDASTSNLTITNVNDLHTGGYFCTAHISEVIIINSIVAYLTVNCEYGINYLCRSRKARCML